MARTLVAAAMCVVAIATGVGGLVPEAGAASTQVPGTPHMPPAIRDAMDASVMATRGYDAGHPDSHFRALGVEARQRGHAVQARQYFRNAARYADKLSQAALAEMFWTGEGGARDRALGYAWMDLAAERGTPWLLVRREHYWRQLDDGERTRAVAQGQAIYTEFADDVAKPRLAHRLRVARNSATGSRLGWVGNGLRIFNTDSPVDALAGRVGTTVTADDYYDDRYWKPDEYFDWQDRLLRTAPREENVDVGPLQLVPDGASTP